MSSIVQNLTKRGLVNPHSLVTHNIHYEVVTGSVAYGVASDDSDWDLTGFCIPRKDVIFPHLTGKIDGFDDKQPFEQWRAEKIVDGQKKREYDITIFNIVRYFRLCVENNPNMIDTLFVPRECILHTTAIGEMVREKRHIFLHKGLWPRLKGYAYQQLSKMQSKNREGKRKEIVEEFGFDVKFAYHVIRLLDQAEQLLSTGDMDLRRAKEQMKAIRRGEVPAEKIKEWADSKEKHLETLYAECKLPWGRHDVEPKVKQLLIDCLEHHYGSLGECVGDAILVDKTITEIELIIQRYRSVQ